MGKIILNVCFTSETEETKKLCVLELQKLVLLEQLNLKRMQMKIESIIIQWIEALKAERRVNTVTNTARDMAIIDKLKEIC